MRKLQVGNERKEPVWDIEDVCFCNSTWHLLWLAGIIPPNVRGGRSDSVRLRCPLWKKKEKPWEHLLSACGPGRNEG